MGSKHCDTYGKSVWAAKETILKNKPDWFTFQKSSIVNLIIIHI